jgi:hypothetical protein
MRENDATAEHVDGQRAIVVVITDADQGGAPAASMPAPTTAARC